MKNPFQYAGKMFVYSERRFGKTSLVKLALAKLPKKRYITAYIDLWPTDSEGTFVTTVAKAITEAMHCGSCARTDAV